MADEEAVAEVGAVDFIRERARAVAIWGGGGGLYLHAAAGITAVVGIVEGVDVDGQSQCVLRYSGRGGYGAVAEAGGVVGPHAALVVGIVVVDELHAPDGIAVVVELTENGEQVGGDGLVADELAPEDAPLAVVVEHAEVAQVGGPDVRVGTVRPSADAPQQVVADGLCPEALGKGGGAESGGRDHFAGLPRVGGRGTGGLADAERPGAFVAVGTDGEQDEQGRE